MDTAGALEADVRLEAMGGCVTGEFGSKESSSVPHSSRHALMEIKLETLLKKTMRGPRQWVLVKRLTWRTKRRCRLMQDWPDW